MSKPVVCLDLDEQNSTPSYLYDLALEHFQVVLMKDFEESHAKDVVAILNMHTIPKITKPFLEKLPNLKIVAIVGVGYNHVDVKMLNSFGVKVSNVAHALDDTAADIGMLLMMAAARNLCYNVSFAMAPTTTSFPKNEVSVDIHSSTLGIVGMGRIGYKVAERAKAFNMKILYHNRNRRSENEEAAVNATFYAKLNDMLPLCDFVIVVVCLTPETVKIMGAEQFNCMKSSAIFANISRGATVDQDALVEALMSGKIRFAALDVTDPEPLPRDHALLKLPNVIITPHVGSATMRTRKNMMRRAIDNVLAAIEGRPLPSEVH